MDRIHLIKTQLQLFVILFMTAAILVALSLLVETGVQPQVVVAQEPLVSPSPPVNTFSLETLEDYGISLEEIQAAAVPFDLRVTVTASSAAITPGNLVTLTVTITNLGPTNSAQYVNFSHVLPTGMTSTKINFGGTTVISNSDTSPTQWLLADSIPVNNSVSITVSGRLSSICNAIASYQASAVPFNASSDTTLNNNTANASVFINAGKFCLYLPVLRKDPTPTPNRTFYDNFSGDRNWSTSDDDDCSRNYTSGEYEIIAKTIDEECFSPAPAGTPPDGTEVKEGTFKVKARRESGSSNFRVAIYINGSGSNNYYALEVKPGDDCRWKFIRRKDGTSNTLSDGGCNSAINRNSNTNTLELRHQGDKISAYINGTQLGSTYTDSSDLDGKGTGVYARTDQDDDATIRFDDFTVTAQ